VRALALDLFGDSILDFYFSARTHFERPVFLFEASTLRHLDGAPPDYPCADLTFWAALNNSIEVIIRDRRLRNA
jgi:hypothetical protein